MGTLTILILGAWFIAAAYLAGSGRWRSWIVVMSVTPFVIYFAWNQIALANPEAEPMGLDLLAAVLFAPWLLALAIGLLIASFVFMRARFLQRRETK